MRTVKVLVLPLALGALGAFGAFELLAAPTAAAQQLPAIGLTQAINNIVSAEQAQMESVKQYSPLVETYVQYLRPDKDLGEAPNGDKYFLGRAELGKVGKLQTLVDSPSGNPRQFLQMVYVDPAGFDLAHYKFDYVRREFLGEVRCLVFDVAPRDKSAKGRFVGRIWAEDRDYHIVRFNGAINGSTKNSRYLHFDSWRFNAGKDAAKDEWLPAFIYVEQGDLRNGETEKLTFKAQTRLWGYNLKQDSQEQEFSDVRVDAPSAPVDDESTRSHDLSAFQLRPTWDRHAEDNVIDRLVRLGLMGPQGDVDKVLQTVVNNLEVTNNLDIQPEIRCRVLLTSTFESFTIGHTIVLSRGLIDVLPDEASLAAILATEVGHIALDHAIDPQFAFFDRLAFDDADTFRHFVFSRKPEEERAAEQKAAELLKNSPYKDQLATVQLFFQELQRRAPEIPSLISPRLGGRVQTDWQDPTKGVPGATVENKTPRDAVVALPLGGRIKLDPWTDQMQMSSAQPVGAVTERDRMPFELNPFLPYLTRQGQTHSTQSATAGTPAAASPER